MRVIDKRMFDAAGELREEVKKELEELSQRPPEPPKPEPPQGAPPRAEADQPDDGPADPGFARLVVTLSNQAGLALGLLADPLNPGRTVDLATARAIIDMLEALESKTHGNLNAEERQLLESVQYELRMAYVDRTRQPARK